VKPVNINVRSLNLAAVRLTSVQVTNLPVYHKIRKKNVNCFTRPGQTVHAYVVRKENFLVTCYM
jgi:hypothetical protein